MKRKRDDRKLSKGAIGERRERERPDGREV